ncbi:MAG TPA: glycosyltransferase [Thermoanaerobaculia bacterium]|nr:glycosyltransferase [Thermoanaerobaculia bacterium]
MSDIDVIVLDFGGGEMLTRCLRSIAAQTLVPSRVILLDNASPEPSRSFVPEGYPIPLVLLAAGTNLGFAGGVNQAMESVRSPLVAWVNNDVVLDAAWLETVRRPFEGDPRLAAAQTVIASDDGATIDGAGIDISDGTYRQLHHGDHAGTQIAEAWGVSATAALYRVDALRDAARNYGIVDTRFFAWYEDVELCARLVERGWRMRVVPEILARHEGSASAASLGAAGMRLRIRNRYFVNRLHPAVGRRSALLREDLRRLLRAFAMFRWRQVLGIKLAVAEGLFSRLASRRAPPGTLRP